MAPASAASVDFYCSTDEMEIRIPHVGIHPHDATSNVQSAVVYYFALDGRRIDLDDDDRNTLIPHYQNFTEDYNVFAIHIMDKDLTEVRAQELPHNKRHDPRIAPPSAASSRDTFPSVATPRTLVRSEMLAYANSVFSPATQSMVWEPLCPH